jgi:hypothetical protein
MTWVEQESSGRGALHRPGRQRRRPCCPDLVGRGVVPDLVTDQTSAHDPLAYIPDG